MPPTVRILQPTAAHTGANALPSTFLVHGTAEGTEIGRVRTYLTLADGTVVQGRLLRFAAHPSKKLYLYQWWAAIPKAGGPKAQAGTVTVQALARGPKDVPLKNAEATAEVKIEVAAVIEGGAPLISYPPAGYTITGGECDAFMPFGGSEIAMTDCTVGGTKCSFLDWTAEIEFWYAFFTGLGAAPGPGAHALVASNGDGDTARRVIVDC